MTTIVEVQGENITPITLIDLQLGTTTYYITSNWKPVTVGGNAYTELGAFLSMANMTDDLKYNSTDLTLTLSGIPSNENYLSEILTENIKGGNVTIQRGFVDPSTYALTGTQYTRFKGIITSKSVNSIK